MATIHLPIDAALSDIVSSEDLTADQKIRAIQDSLSGSTQEQILLELKKMNVYFAMMLDHRL